MTPHSLRPRFDVGRAAGLAEELYGLRCEATELASYSDQNFRLKDASGLKYVLKIANADVPAEVLDFQHGALDMLSKESDLSFKTPHLYQSLSGEYLTAVHQDGRFYLVWLVSFLEGQFMADLSLYSSAFLKDLGHCMGRLDHILSSYTHPAMNRVFMWDLKQIPMLDQYVDLLDTDGQKQVRFFLDRYSDIVQPLLPHLRQSVIHNDANDHNILVDATGTKVTGLIDFGDMVHTYTVCELAIAAAYAILGHADPLQVLADLLLGYETSHSLTPPERDAYFHFVCLRLCTSVCLSAERRLQEPDNVYLSVSEKPAWQALHQLSSLDIPHW